MSVKSAASGFMKGLVGTAASIANKIAFVPVYLSHLRWLISRTFRELAEKGYGGNAAVYAVLRLLSTSVPEPPLLSYHLTDDGEPGERLPYDDPLQKLIRRPNPHLSEFEFWELMTLYTGIKGRANCWKERGNVGVIALWPLRPDRVGPIYAKPGDADRVIVGWSYQIPGTMDYLQIPAADVLTFNFPNPAGESGGMVEGLGPLDVLSEEVSSDNEATRFVGATLANGGAPTTILTVQGKLASQDDAQIIKRAFMRDFGGARRGQPAVIDEGTTITSLGFNLQQLEFPSLRQVTESRICGAFGVPPILAHLLVGLQSEGEGSGLDQIRSFFAETTLACYWRRFSDTYTHDVASEFGSDLICRFDLTKVRALAAQSSVRLAEIRDMFERGALTIDEYRDAAGFEKIGGPMGDMFAYGIAPGRGQEVMVSSSGGLITGPTGDQQSLTSNPAGTETPEARDASSASSTMSNARVQAHANSRTSGQAREHRSETGNKGARMLPMTNPEAARSGDTLLAEGEMGVRTAFDTLMADLERVEEPVTPSNGQTNGH